MKKYNSTKTASSGLGFCDVLTLIFVVLKLVHVIDWPWIWVLSPLWIGLVIGLFVILVVLIVSAVSTIKDNRHKKEDTWLDEM